MTTYPLCADGKWLEPTICTEATPDMPIARAEVFGPILVGMKFETEKQAVAIVNDSDNGRENGWPGALHAIFHHPPKALLL